MPTAEATRTSFIAGIKIPHSMLDYILTGAFEGGINYWCSKAEDGHEGEIKRIRTLEGEHSKDNAWYADYENKFVYKLWDADTNKPFKVGQKFKAVRNGKSFDVQYRHLDVTALREGITQWINESIEDGEDLMCGPSMDAGVYDQIVQYAVFQGLVFG